MDSNQGPDRQATKPVVFAHGLPGSASADLRIAGLGEDVSQQIIGLERLACLDHTGEDTVARDYAAAVLADFDTKAASVSNHAVRLVGFSLGAMSALHIAAARPERVASLELIAPAAPLALGDFLPLMAGKPVFSAARAGKWQLALLARLQRQGLQLFPQAMARMLFRSSSPAEQALMARPAESAAFIDGCKAAIVTHAAGYRRELRAYVTDWTEVLSQISPIMPLRIWQGTADNWVPPAMASALAERLGRADSITWLEGAGHYMALQQAMTEIAGSD